LKPFTDKTSGEHPL